MTKIDTNDKKATFIKKSRKLSTKNNNLVLTSRTVERQARGKKHHLVVIFVLCLLQEYNAIKSLLAQV